MKKFLLAAMIFTVIIGQNAHAAAVNLCDFSLSQFVERYNAVVDAGELPQAVMIRNLDNRQQLNYKGYTNYTTFIGDEGHGAIFFVFVDNQGRVAELSWIFGIEDEPSQVGTVMSLTASLFATGLNEYELNSFINKMPSTGPKSNTNFSVWCSSIGRQICFKNTYAPNGRAGLTQINLFAER